MAIDYSGIDPYETEEERQAALEAGAAYEGIEPTATRDGTRVRPPTSIFEQALVRPTGRPVSTPPVPTVPQAAPALPTAPVPAADIFRSMLRTGAEVGGGAQLFRGATSIGKRSSMADALRIGQRSIATRAATPRAIARQKKQNILGLNISPGIGLQV